MINIDFASGKATADTSAAVPAVTARQIKAGVHLTKGYLSPDTTPATDPDNPPVVITGTVDVNVDTRQELDQVLNGSFFFGFLQVAKVKELSASWEGRRKGEGSVVILVVGFPVSDTLVLLDSDTANQPFFARTPHLGSGRNPKPDQRGLAQITTSMGDHPNYRDHLITANSITKARNFLHKLHFSVDFTTVFVAQDGTGPIQPIAHVEWHLELHAEVKWRQGKPITQSRLSSIVPGKSRLGAPTDPAVRAIIDNPGPPLVKGVVIDRYREAMANPRMRQESDQRSLLVPRDFFQ